MICKVCWTISWAPASPKKIAEIKNRNISYYKNERGDYRICQYCELLDKYLELKKKKAKQKIEFKVYDKKTGKEIKPKFDGDLCIGENVVIVRDFKPNNCGGYSLHKTRVYETIDLDIFIIDDENNLLPAKIK